MKNEHELKLINDSIEAYQNTIKFIRSQILDLHRKKNTIINDECKACFDYEFKFAPTPEPDDDYCETCECTPCDCDFGEENRYIKNE